MKQSAERQIKLGLSMAGHGYHDGAWLHADSVLHGPSSFPYYLELAQTAERGLFDLVFLADLSYFPMSDVPKGALGRRGESGLEPLTLLAALAPQTTHIGLVATASTTFSQPYHLARAFASIDQISGGRCGWNVVTSSQDEEARNFSLPAMPPNEQRYERAEEFVHVVQGLWDSFDDDTFVADRSRGVFFDASKVRPVRHCGRNFSVEGPLNVRRSPQGRPVVVQAGTSDQGQDLAAKFADIVYTIQTDMESSRAFCTSIRARLQKFGRAPEDVRIMPGLMPIVGRSAAEAEDKYEKLKELVHPLIGLEYLSIYFGDLSSLPIDGPLPELSSEQLKLGRGRFLRDMAKRNDLSIRELYQTVCVSNGHHTVVGTAESIADVMQTWFTSEAADGFNILPAVSPGSLQDFVDNVVPELQRRGLYRTRYDGTTLRDHLGLACHRTGTAAAASA